jgi:Arc/MetJ-type ribon-helix-helix transcriptional regulator
MLSMVRTQIQLTEQQAHRLRRAAADRHTSVSALIREAVDRTIDMPDAADLRRGAMRAAGVFASTEEDLAERHDDYAAQAYAE